MAKKIIIPANEVWDFFCDNQETQGFLIASDEDFGVEISLDLLGNYPEVYVTCYDDILESRIFVTPSGCDNGVQEMYDKYLSGNVNEITRKDDNDDAETAEEIDEDIEVAIDRRQLELEMAADELLCALAPNADEYTDDYDEMIKEMIEVACEYLYNVYSISVYRPMFIEQADGSELYTEYPYDHTMK